MTDFWLEFLLKLYRTSVLKDGSYTLKYSSSLSIRGRVPKKSTVKSLFANPLENYVSTMHPIATYSSTKNTTVLVIIINIVF